MLASDADWSQGLPASYDDAVLLPASALPADAEPSALPTDAELMLSHTLG